MTPPTTLETVIKRSSLINEPLVEPLSKKTASKAEKLTFDQETAQISAASKKKAPVIVVGLPRSGSSYLAHVLSCLDDWFIFDDLYPYQKADSLGISSTFDLSQDLEKLQQFINLLSWQLWAKIKFEQHFQVPNLSLEDPFEMEAALLEAFGKYAAKASGPITWPMVLREWMTRLALHSGSQNWGYKTPQDFMHMDELADIFPGVKFVFIMRDPREVMKSYKNLPRVKTEGKQDGESRQYHPVPYALYWKNAYEKVQNFISRKRSPVETVRFEDLVANPNAVADRLACFLETSVAGQVIAKSANSSVGDGVRQELTSTEIFICEKIAGNCMQESSYPLSGASPRASDIFSLIETSITFAMYQAKRVATSKKARTSVIAMVRSLLNR